MIWSTDDKGACTYISEGLTKLTGRSSWEVRGYRWLDALHPDDRSLVKAIMTDACRLQEPFSFQYRMKTKEGGYAWVLSGAVPSFGPPDQTFLGFLGSITHLEKDSRGRHAFGQIGESASTKSRVPLVVTDLDMVADHLLLARASAQPSEHHELKSSIDFALDVVARQLTALRPSERSRPN